MKTRKSGIELRIGIDFGRVIMGAARPDGSADTSFLSGSEARALETAAEPGALGVLRELCRAAGGNVWIVSKCGPRIERRTRRWLEHHEVFERTGLDPAHLRFCRERREKRVHCRELGITHFVDDRRDVLEHLRGLVPHLFLYGVQPPAPAAPAWLTPVADWSAVRRALLGREVDEGGSDALGEPDAVGGEEEGEARLGHRP